MTTDVEHPSTELAAPVELLDVETGEVLPATVPNAARVIVAARDMKNRADWIVRAATDWLVEETRRVGKKTLDGGSIGKVVVSGGPSTDYDAELVGALLRDAGCPEERIDEAVKATVTYKVDRAVLRQLAAANPDYAAAIELAEIQVEKSYSASVKP